MTSTGGQWEYKSAHNRNRAIEYNDMQEVCTSSRLVTALILMLLHNFELRMPNAIIIFIDNLFAIIVWTQEPTVPSGRNIQPGLQSPLATPSAHQVIELQPVALQQSRGDAHHGTHVLQTLTSGAWSTILLHMFRSMMYVWQAYYYLPNIIVTCLLLLTVTCTSVQKKQIIYV